MTILDLDIGSIQRQVAELGEAWRAFSQQLSEILADVGGSVSAEIPLGDGLQERVKVGYNYITRYYSRALIKISVRRGSPISFSVEFGVVGKKGIFYPAPESYELKRFIVLLRELEYFVVWYGGGSKFVKALLENSKRAAVIEK